MKLLVAIAINLLVIRALPWQLGVGKGYVQWHH